MKRTNERNPKKVEKKSKTDPIVMELSCKDCKTKRSFSRSEFDDLRKKMFSKRDNYLSQTDECMEDPDLKQRFESEIDDMIENAMDDPSMLGFESEDEIDRESIMDQIDEDNIWEMLLTRVSEEYERDLSEADDKKLLKDYTTASDMRYFWKHVCPIDRNEDDSELDCSEDDDDSDDHPINCSLKGDGYFKEAYLIEDMY